jgi:LuxR family maltose regulon positive regulatory protein
MATIVAPAGYGKTTLLAQWADRDAREVLGVAFEPEDDDPDAVELLLRPIAEEPGLLALLDDVHVIRSPEAVDALARLLDHAPAGTTVALAGRSLPPLSLARVRAEGRLIEIATENLALTSREAESLPRQPPAWATDSKGGRQRSTSRHSRCVKAHRSRRSTATTASSPTTSRRSTS